MLNKAVSDLFNMCEIEGKEDYAKGVLETLESSSEDLKKLIHRLNIETLGTAPNKSVAWELSHNMNTSELPNKPELETFIEDLERLKVWTSLC